MAWFGSDPNRNPKPYYQVGIVANTTNWHLYRMTDCLQVQRPELATDRDDSFGSGSRSERKHCQIDVADHQ
jgi:hypothetical protein